MSKNGTILGTNVLIYEVHRCRSAIIADGIAHRKEYRLCFERPKVTKMKMSSKRLISLLLVLAMTVALLCVGVYADPVDETTDPTAADAAATETQPAAESPAAEEPVAVEPAAPAQPATVPAAPATPDPRTDGKKVLTIIGDSIPAGYGLSENVNSLINQFTLHGATIVDGSYPQILRDEAGFDVVHKDARESYTAINYLRWIDEEYDNELAQPKNYYLRWLSECTFFLPKIFGAPTDDTETLKANIKNDIATSDAIVLNLGNNDTFTMALLDFFLRSEYYVYGMAAQPALSALKGKLNLATSLDDLIQMFGGTYADIFTKEEEYLQLFKKNMDRMIRAIRQLNPTAEIYYVGMYNTFEYAEPEDDAIRDFLYQAGVDLCNKLEHYAKEECAFRNDIHYVDVMGTQVWKSDTIYSPSYWLRFLVHCHPDYEGHRFMAEQIMKAMGMDGDTNCPLAKFVDLIPTSWYHEPIDYVLKRGIMDGMTDNMFGPEVTLTRAMVVTMLYAMDGKPSISNLSPFNDVAATDWFVNPVVWAADNGVVSGYDDGSFRPTNPVTREELATMLRSYAQYRNKDTSASGDLSAFVDQSTVSGWAAESVSWAVGHGIINGRSGNRIAPKGTATRAEAATMFTRLCQNVL